MISFSSQWRVILLVFVFFLILGCKFSSVAKNSDKSVDSAKTNAELQPVDGLNEGTKSGIALSEDDGTGAVTSDDKGVDAGSPDNTGIGVSSPDGDVPEPLKCTRYVSINGDDTNSGLTYESAWRTLQHAANQAPEGSVICAMEGVYQERVVVQRPNLSFQSHPRLSATSDGGFELQADDSHIQGFNITTQVTSDFPERCTLFIRANRASVVDNYFYDVKGDPAIQGNWKDYPRDVWIAFNRIYNSASGINVQGENWLVEYNEVERLHSYGYSDADYTRFHGDNHIFRHNTFHGTSSDEIGSAHVDCFQTFDGGSWADHTFNIVIENNVCSGFHQGIMSEARHNNATDTITVRNNVFANYDSSFIRNSHGIIVKDIPYYTIEHNTFVNIGVRGVLVKQAEYGAAKYEIVKNNIFFNINGTAYSFWDGTETSQGGYNIIYQSGDSDPKWPEDLTGLDPLFIDADQRDYHLQSNSPACDSGENGTYIGAYPCE